MYFAHPDSPIDSEQTYVVVFEDSMGTEEGPTGIWSEIEAEVMKKVADDCFATLYVIGPNGFTGASLWLTAEHTEDGYVYDVNRQVG